MSALVILSIKHVSVTFCLRACLIRLFLKSSVSPRPNGNTKTVFSKLPLWRAFSKRCGRKLYPPQKKLRYQTKTDMCRRGLSHPIPWSYMGKPMLTMVYPRSSCWAGGQIPFRLFSNLQPLSHIASQVNEKSCLKHRFTISIPFFVPSLLVPTLLLLIVVI